MFRYEEIAEYIRTTSPDNGMTRSEVASYFQIGKGGALAHLERAVDKGLLIKVYTWCTNRQRGWVYLSPERQPGLFSDSELQALGSMQ